MQIFQHTLSPGTCSEYNGQVRGGEQQVPPMPDPPEKKPHKIVFFIFWPSPCSLNVALMKGMNSLWNVDINWWVILCSRTSRSWAMAIQVRRTCSRQNGQVRGLKWIVPGVGRAICSGLLGWLKMINFPVWTGFRKKISGCPYGTPNLQKLLWYKVSYKDSLGVMVKYEALNGLAQIWVSLKGRPVMIWGEARRKSRNKKFRRPFSRKWSPF